MTQESVQHLDIILGATFKPPLIQSFMSYLEYYCNTGDSRLHVMDFLPLIAFFASDKQKHSVVQKQAYSMGGDERSHQEIKIEFIHQNTINQWQSLLT